MATHAVFLLGESHGQRSLAATVHGVAESDTTERLSTAQQVCQSHYPDVSLSPFSLCVLVSGDDMPQVSSWDAEEYLPPTHTLIFHPPRYPQLTSIYNSIPPNLPPPFTPLHHCTLHLLTPPCPLPTHLPTHPKQQLAGLHPCLLYSQPSVPSSHPCTHPTPHALNTALSANTHHPEQLGGLVSSF